MIISQVSYRTNGPLVSLTCGLSAEWYIVILNGGLKRI